MKLCDCVYLFFYVAIGGGKGGGGTSPPTFSDIAPPLHTNLKVPPPFPPLMVPDNVWMACMPAFLLHTTGELIHMGTQ